MKVKEFADRHGVSKQFCYQQIKGAGKSIGDYTDSRGDLSPDGIALLESLIPDKTESTEKTDNPVRKKSTYDQLLEELKSQYKQQISELKEDKQKLEEEKKELQAKYDEKSNEISELAKGYREQSDKAHQLADQAQRLQAKNQELTETILKIKSGSISPEHILLPAEGEVMSQETEEPTAADQTEEKQDPAGESPEQKEQDPEKREGETAPADQSSSPVTAEKTDPKPEQKKPTFRQRLHYLLHGE